MRTSNDFGMVWWAAATAALGICVPAQEAAAVWNAHEEEKFIAAIQDAIDYTMTGEASPTQNLTETPDPVNFVWEGLRTQGGSVVNTGVLSHRIDEKVSVSAAATMRLDVREFKSTPGSINDPWTMDHWNVPNLTGDGLELVPIFNYTRSQEVILLATGITVDGGTGENRGRIDIGASLHADLSARAAFEFSTEQSVPTKDQVKEHGQTGRPSFDWFITPGVKSTAQVQLTMTLAALVCSRGFQSVGLRKHPTVGLGPVPQRSSPRRDH